MRIHLVQNDAVWNRPEQSLKELDLLISNYFLNESKEGLLVLPEMFAHGFVTEIDITKNQAIILHNQLMILDWMKKTANLYNVIVTGSIQCLQGGSLYNRLYAIGKDSSLETADYYDKRHLFSLAGENIHFSAGVRRSCWEFSGWKLLPSICYDLRFPVWMRNQADYHLILCVANWPKTRSYAWRSLLIARAIENQSYVVGVNRVGVDGTGTLYAGGSMVVGPDGAVLSQMDDQKGIKGQDLDAHALAVFRRAYPFLADADSFTLTSNSTV